MNALEEAFVPVASGLEVVVCSEQLVEQELKVIREVASGDHCHDFGQEVSCSADGGKILTCESSGYIG